MTGDPAELLDQARSENRVLAALAALAASNHEYDDVVQAVLDVVEQVVDSPYLSLSLQEAAQTGHYTRADRHVDRHWVEEVGWHVEEMQRRYLEGTAAAAPRVATTHLAAPAAWIASFPADTRSGRTGALTLACPQPLTMEPHEEQLMLRLSQQAILVLDHALLVQQLESLEETDHLTGAVSHRRLLEILDYEMQRHRHSDKRLALILLDVDGLDGINRSYGRQYGNHILKKLAGLVQQTVRPIDVVARFGLDELAVVLPETDEEEGRQLSERLRESILAVEFAGGAIGLSVGVAQVKPDEMLSAETFLRRAETALHEAKRQDRGWTVLARPEARKATR